MANVADGTVVAVYNDATGARDAAAHLESMGFPEDHIYVTSGSGEYPPNSARFPVRHKGGIKEWFLSLFGSEEHDHKVAYESALARGKTIVSVDSSSSDFRKASEILLCHSPIALETDDHMPASVLATPNSSDTSYLEIYPGGRSDLLNARDELNTPLDQEGSPNRPVGRLADLAVPTENAIRTGNVCIYPRSANRVRDEENTQ